MNETTGTRQNTGHQIRRGRVKRLIPGMDTWQLEHADRVILIVEMLRESIFFGLLAAAMYTEISQGRIPNILTVPCMVFGLAIAFGLGGIYSPQGGLVDHLLGVIIPVGIFGVPFMLGWFGGGDIKLLAAIGAVEGIQFVIAAMFFSAVAGGVIAVIALLSRAWRKKGNADATAAEEGQAERVISFPDHVPFGVAIGIGSAFAWFLSVL